MTELREKMDRLSLRKIEALAELSQERRCADLKGVEDPISRALICGAASGRICWLVGRDLLFPILPTALVFDDTTPWRALSARTCRFSIGEGYPFGSLEAELRNQPLWVERAVEWLRAALPPQSKIIESAKEYCKSLASAGGKLHAREIKRYLWEEFEVDGREAEVIWREVRPDKRRLAR